MVESAMFLRSFRQCVSVFRQSAVGSASARCAPPQYKAPHLAGFLHLVRACPQWERESVAQGMVSTKPTNRAGERIRAITRR